MYQHQVVVLAVKDYGFLPFLHSLALAVTVFLGGRNGERNATVGDVQRATDFAALERQNNETVASVRQGVYDTSAAIKDGNYNILGELRDLQTVTNAGFAEQSKCCCETNRNIDSVRFDMANYSAATQAAIHAEGATYQKYVTAE